MSFNGGYTAVHSGSFASAADKRYHPYEKASNDRHGGNNRNSSYRDAKPKGFGIKHGQQGFKLREIDWNAMDLKPFQRNFYHETKHTCNQTDAEIILWRKKENIKVYVGFNNALNDANFQWNKKFNDGTKRGGPRSSYYNNHRPQGVEDDYSYSSFGGGQSSSKAEAEEEQEKEIDNASEITESSNTTNKSNSMSALKSVDEEPTKDFDEAAEESSETVAEVINLTKMATVPKPVLTFDDIEYPNYIKKSFIQQGFTAPTAIQAQAWPIVLSGNDLIGIAKTGSGKTLAFLLPAMIHIHAQLKQRALEPSGHGYPSSFRGRNGYGRGGGGGGGGYGGGGGRRGRGRGRGRGRRNNGYGGRGGGYGGGGGDGGAPIALVVAPTRELAMQIEEECDKFCGQQIRHVCVYGGVSRYHQSAKIRRGVEIVVATPGRLLDFVESKVVRMTSITYVVIDEADRLLDMGFEPQLNCILNQIRPDRQITLFSATWPMEVRNLAKRYVKYNEVHYPTKTEQTNSITLNCENNLIQVSVGGDMDELNCNKDVTQTVQLVERHEKITKLKLLLTEYKEMTDGGEKILVFISTKKMCNTMYDILWNDGYYVTCIHGDKAQAQRDRALKAFKSGEMNIMLATDVASRGIHVDNIGLVVNFDFPMHIQDYVHRIGRTGRAGKKGKAISFFTRGVDDKRTHNLIKVLKQAEQEIPEELFAMRKNGRNGRYGGGRRFGGGGGGRRFGGGGGNRRFGGGGRGRGRGGSRRRY